ncbi:SEL1-like repeat protein [Candidatus Odyssella acanthamoebae]|uniref:Sel1 repeat protein n=1 Tax=Candidatus Odyssella acanthamoebae TaxID=91604 RepID=A0A077AXA8_9PROT|nr:SEL1-like repeat protein [Candidatus Paracaedibacter acanthamoebae]AIK97231.1 hypothetical protein ID47_11570 [Candidatus Paracaedibacter acanthamoebae]
MIKQGRFYLLDGVVEKYPSPVIFQIANKLFHNSTPSQYKEEIAKEMIYLLKLAAQQLDGNALNLLACWYENGKGTQKDEHQAFTYFKKAADHGIERKKDRLNDLYKEVNEN